MTCTSATLDHRETKTAPMGAASASSVPDGAADSHTIPTACEVVR